MALRLRLLIMPELPRHGRETATKVGVTSHARATAAMGAVAAVTERFVLGTCGRESAERCVIAVGVQCQRAGSPGLWGGVARDSSCGERGTSTARKCSRRRAASRTAPTTGHDGRWCGVNLARAQRRCWCRIGQRRAQRRQ